MSVKKYFLLIFSLFIVFSFIGCGKSDESGSVKDDITITNDQDNVTKYKRKGLKGKAVTNVPPVDYEHSAQTSQKFKQSEE